MVSGYARAPSTETEAASEAEPPFDPIVDAMRPQITGRTLLLFDENATASDRRDILKRGLAERAEGLDVSIASATIGGGERVLAGAAVKASVFDRVGIAILEAGPQGRANMSMLVNSYHDLPGIVEARPEFVLHAFETYADTEESTWGLEASGAAASPFTGKGIKIAVLDTGLAFDHPDFRHRDVVSRSFVSGQPQNATDGRGHGTHCIGTATGPRLKTNAAPGYGCAPDASLYVGKVLADNGSGAEGDVVAGIEWALDEECEVISLSLGREVQVGTPPSAIYERLGASALVAGSLIVAAAGNNSLRTSGFIAPVSIPANAKSIMAVAALDSDLAVAYFSNGGRNPAAFGIDIAAPGTRVFSSYLMSQLYEVLSGTSMATPHVAGIAALWAESNPNLRGEALWQALIDHAMAIPGDRRDVGAGLVQAPGSATS